MSGGGSEEETMEQKEWLERWKETGKLQFQASQSGSKGIGLKVSKSSQALRNSIMPGIQEVAGTIRKKFNRTVASESRSR